MPPGRAPRAPEPDAAPAAVARCASWFLVSPPADEILKEKIRRARLAGPKVERIEKQLQRIDEKLLLEQAPHVEPITTHHDSGTAHEGSGETGDRAGAGDSRVAVRQVLRSNSTAVPELQRPLSTKDSTCDQGWNFGLGERRTQRFAVMNWPNGRRRAALRASKRR
jgi:hypothetical protein